MRILFLLLIFYLFSSSLYAEINELTFSQAAQLAIEASSQLRHARSSQAIMEGAWKWGLRAYFPRVGITVSENDRLQQTGADSFMKNYGLSLDQLIFDGGRTSMNRRLERMELDLSSVQLDRSASEIGEAAISAYRNVLSSREILEIKNSALTVLEEQRRILNEEVQLGLALPVDLASADINLASARLDIISLEIDLAEMEKQFTEILNLESLPQLIEKVDVNRPSSFNLRNAAYAAVAAASIAKDQNPDLQEARFSISKRQAEYRLISNSWIPVLRFNGNFGLSGQRYPLTRHNWSVGISVELSSPWLKNNFSFQTGWEPSSFGQPDRTANLQNSLNPLPDPASSYGKKQAALALSSERENYAILLERIGRIAANAVEKCVLAGQKRLLAAEAAALGNERSRIEEIRLGLGHITRLKLMEVLIEQTQREIAVVQAATALLEAERELERFLDLQPGELINLIHLRSE